MATVEQRIRTLEAVNNAPKGLLGVAALVRELGISPASRGVKVARRWWHHGLRYDDKKPFVFPPIELCREWLDSDDRCMDLIEVSHGWARVKLTGWAGYACKACKKHPVLETGSVKRIGEHAMVRIDERGRVAVRCWCSAKIMSYDQSELPAKDLNLLPDMGKRKKRRKKAS